MWFARSRPVRHSLGTLAALGAAILLSGTAFAQAAPAQVPTARPAVTRTPTRSVTTTRYHRAPYRPGTTTTTTRRTVRYPRTPTVRTSRPASYRSGAAVPSRYRSRRRRWS
ncbi:MAG: hypothetical protein JO023_02260 [Chloroflexi bacterium]|nr:hypothetical protein [Chloroflexota bacterium]